jgi:hypothetical protein
MNKRNTNGHAEPQGRANGHAAAFSGHGSGAAQADLAGSHHGGEKSAANGAIAAGAAVAAQRAQRGAAKLASPGENDSSGKAEKDSVHFPGPTNSEAMQDAGAYVNAVAERVDLVAASVRLVESGDHKIAKAELDRLRDMKFGKVGPPPVEEQEWPELGDLPRPPR